MDVQLYVYDLSRGLARQLSTQLLGIHLDAVYHTSLVFGGIEYFYGAGIQTCYPGATHHGRPMEVVALGRTDLPTDIIANYLDEMKHSYTAASYDLFEHNCNNFTEEFATFLLGKGIPQNITSLPRRVLDTPFGQMLRPQIDAALRGVTQAPAPPHSLLDNPTKKPGKKQLPRFLSASVEPILHKQAPPIDRLEKKLGSSAEDPAIASAIGFLEASSRKSGGEVKVPDLKAVQLSMGKMMEVLPTESLFAVHDLLGAMMLDQRVSDFFTDDQSRSSEGACNSFVSSLLARVNRDESCPFNLRLCAIRMSCNLFTSPSFRQSFDTKQCVAEVIHLASSALLDTQHAKLRLHGSSLAYNITTCHFTRSQKSQNAREAKPGGWELDLAAALDSVLDLERDNPEVLRNATLTLGRLVYPEAEESEVRDLCRALNTGAKVRSKSGLFAEGDRWIVTEVGGEILSHP